MNFQVHVLYKNIGGKTSMEYDVRMQRVVVVPGLLAFGSLDYIYQPANHPKIVRWRRKG